MSALPPAPPAPPHPGQQTLQGSLLSFVAGFVDTLGFVSLFGLFTAHVTGNFVLLGAALIRPHNGLIAKLLALPVFVLAVALTGLIVGARESARKPVFEVVVGGQMFLLACFSLLAWKASPVTDADAPLAVVAGLCGVAAMGVQNAAAKLLFADLPPTTVMTGNVTQFSLDLTHLARHRQGEDMTDVRARLARFTPPVAAFAAGAVCGALGYSIGGFPMLLVPIAVLAIVIVVHRSSHRS
jgi:uncharacterized membrane protein YoaK (UPF0700 family)